MTDRALVRRGRPKGTGIDDTALLERLKAALAADPNLRPTAAIRAVGVADPSAIRRLRDKIAAAPAPAGRATKSGIERPAVPLKAGPAAVKKARARPAATGKAEAPAKVAAVRADTQTLASYLAAVGGAPAPTAVAASAPNKPAGATPEPARNAGIATSDTPTKMRTPAKDNPKTSSAGASEAFPSPFEMMARMATPVALTPQTMLEAVRLTVEATAAISRLQVFMMQGSLKGTQLAMMLQGQAAMAQMMLATLAGTLARPPTKT